MVTLHDGEPVVKVIDFGVAKATMQKLTEKTLFTAYGQMIGTPAYMSPEQAEMSGLDIDTRSDVYSLGVKAIEIREPLVADNPSFIGARIGLGRNYCDLGVICFDNADDLRSLQWLDKSVQTLTAV